MQLPSFTYDIHSGPKETLDEVCVSPLTGNCRLAVQLYLYLVHGLWLPPTKVLCPALFRSTGHTVEGGLSNCLEGDVILAERIRNKNGDVVDRSRNFYATEEEWILYLHSAVVIAPQTENSELRIWHATSITGGTCEWSRSEFETYYRVVAVKRILEV